jgi:hypothetical protein
MLYRVLEIAVHSVHLLNTRNLPFHGNYNFFTTFRGMRARLACVKIVP